MRRVWSNSGEIFTEFCFARIENAFIPAELPGAVSGIAGRGHPVGRRVQVRNSVAVLLRAQRNIVFDRYPIFRAGNRVHRKRANIFFGEQVIQRIRAAFYVHRVVLNRFAQHPQIRTQGGLVRLGDHGVVTRDGNRDQDDHDGHHHHQLNQSEAPRNSAAPPQFFRIVDFLPHGSLTRPALFPQSYFIYQSEYFVPSSAVPEDLLYTSKTSWPPQPVASTSSCTEHNPQSLFLVMGSSPISRKNRMRLSVAPVSCVGFTSVSRSTGYPSVPAFT